MGDIVAQHATLVKGFVAKQANDDRLGPHLRQDLKLIAFLLFGVIVMLGIVADRIG